MAAEEKFGVKIPDDELPKLKTVGDAVTTSRRTPSSTLQRASTVRSIVGGTRPYRRRRRHRARRHHPARRRRRRRPGTACSPGRSGVVALDRGLGRRTCRCGIAAPMAVDPTEVLRPGPGPPAGPQPSRPRWSPPARRGPTPASPARRATPASTRPASPSSSAPASAASLTPARPVRHPGGEGPRPGLAAAPSRCSCRTGRPPTSGWSSARRPACTRPVSACASGAEAIALRPRPDRSSAAPTSSSPAAPRPCIHPLPSPASPQMRAMSTRNDEPRARLPAVRQGPRRLRARRGRRRARARAAPTRRGPRRARRTPCWPAPASPSDAYDIVAPDPRATAQRRAIAAALRDAGPDRGRHRARQRARHVDPGRRHRRGRARSADLLGEHTVVTATKSMTGHLLGAAGAIEAIATVLAVRDGVVPPTINLDDPDDERRSVDVVARRAARRCRSPAALNDSFGFGGHNVALVFTRRPDRARRRPVTRHRRTVPSTPTTVDPRDPEVPADAAASTPGSLRLLRRARRQPACSPPRGTVDGAPGDRVLHRRHRDGRRDGRRRLPAHRRRDRHRRARAGAGDRALALRRRPAGRGRRGAATRSARCSRRWSAPPAGSRRSRWCSARPPAAPPTARR